MNDSRKRTPFRPEPAAQLAPIVDLIPLNEALFELVSLVKEQVQEPVGQALGLRLGRVSEGFPTLPFAHADAAMLSEAGESSLVALVRRARAMAACSLAIVPWQLADNWFSHWHPREQVAVISTWNWDNTALVPIEAYLVYELLLNSLAVISPHYSPLALAHEETRGCLWDFCGDKREIEIKLQTMDVCPECRRRLETLGIDAGGVAAECDLVRERACGETERRPYEEGT